MIRTPTILYVLQLKIYMCYGQRVIWYLAYTNIYIDDTLLVHLYIRSEYFESFIPTPTCLFFYQPIQIVLYDMLLRVQINLISTMCKSFYYAFVISVLCGCLVATRPCWMFTDVPVRCAFLGFLNGIWR